MTASTALAAQNTSETTLADNAAQRQNAAYVDGKFVNQHGAYKISFSNILSMAKAYISAERKAPTPSQPHPLHTLTREELDKTQGPTVYRLGHSTILLKLDGHYVLTDPMFSERASMLSFAGPKRFHPTPIAIDDLPPIKAVIISHDHYDHLDKASIQALKDKVEHFYTPLKVGAYLRDWGVNPTKVTELDWWQSASLGDFTFTATPAHHFSGRGLFDRDETLWASWVIASREAKVFFSGDSGYFDGFKAIGQAYGPFDLTMIETGAYNTLWGEIHMMPEQSVQAHMDLNGKAMLPIHNSTFDLALHDWQEPLIRATSNGATNKVTVLTPKFGEPVQVSAPTTFAQWWDEQNVALQQAQQAAPHEQLAQAATASQ